MNTHKLFYLLLLVTLLYTFPAKAQYNWITTPISTAMSRYDDMAWLSPDKGFVIDYGGAFFKTTDGGQSWQQYPGPPGMGYRSVAFLNEDKGFIGKVQATSVTPSDTFTLFKTIDGGQSWSPIPIPSVPTSQQGFCGMSVVNDQVIYAAGRFHTPAYVHKTTDGGTTWTTIDMAPHAKGLIDCYFWSADSGIVVGHNGQPWSTGNSIILLTTDGGQTWQNRYTSTRTGELSWKITFPSKNTGYVSINDQAGNAIYVLKTTDKGQTWQELLVTNGPYYAEGIGFLNDSVGWLGGGLSTLVYHTIDGGQTWTQAQAGSFLNRFRFFGDSLAYASGAKVYKLSTGVVGLPEQSLSKSKLNLLLPPYPNPANQTISAVIEMREAGPLELTMTDIFGRELKKIFQPAEQAAGRKEVNFAVSSLPAGLYFLQLKTASGIQTQKIELMR